MCRKEREFGVLLLAGVRRTRLCSRLKRNYRLGDFMSGMQQGKWLLDVLQELRCRS